MEERKKRTERSEQFRSVYDDFRSYWKVYGGASGVVFSPYFWASILLSLVCLPICLEPKWWEIPKNILPSLIGYSIAGFSLWLSFGSDSFKKAFASKKRNGHSYYLGVTTTFFHFVLVQIIALLLAIIAEAKPLLAMSRCWPVVPTSWIPVFRHIWPYATRIGWFLSFWCFLYSLLLCLAALLALYKVTKIYDAVIGQTQVRPNRSLGGTPRFARRILGRLRGRP